MLSILFTRKQIAEMRPHWGNSLGFAPTMGALHQGHASLFLAAKEQCQNTISSIFVNPLQFNNPQDLEKYPKTLEEDLLILDKTGVDLLFLPNYEDLYNAILFPTFDIGNLNNVLEGTMRPGHFEGVLKVLYAFFDIIQPNHIFFGQKDLQQCMVVEKLVEQHFPQIKMHICPTTRNANGLALSSRNRRLDTQGLATAPAIYKQLQAVHEQLKSAVSATNAIKNVTSKLAEKGIETEYLQLINLPNMEQAHEYNAAQRQALVYAGYLQGIRLIDNLILQ